LSSGLRERGRGVKEEELSQRKTVEEELPKKGEPRLEGRAKEN